MNHRIKEGIYQFIGFVLTIAGVYVLKSEGSTWHLRNQKNFSILAFLIGFVLLIAGLVFFKGRAKEAIKEIDFVSRRVSRFYVL